MGQNNQTSGGRFSHIVALRCLAAGFVLYSLFDIVRGYFAGGEEAPSLLLLILSVLVLGSGGVYIALMAWKEWKKGGTPSEQPASAEQEEPAVLSKSDDQ